MAKSKEEEKSKGYKRRDNEDSGYRGRSDQAGDDDKDNSNVVDDADDADDAPAEPVAGPVPAAD